jgi:hypothetical protein
MIAWPDRDVIAVQVHRAAPGPNPVGIKLRMLRKLSQYFGAELETFARENTTALQTRSHLAKCQLLTEGERIVLTQEFTEDEYYNKSAVAIAILGQAVNGEIVNETEVRLTTDFTGHPATILISSASTFERGKDVMREALGHIDAAAAKGYAGLKSETRDWWHRFWNLGSVHLQSPDRTAQFIEANYHYFLYLMAASSRAAEALHVALLQSAPPEPGGEAVIRLFTAWPKDWDASFQLLAVADFWSAPNSKVEASPSLNFARLPVWTAES